MDPIKEIRTGIDAIKRDINAGHIIAPHLWDRIESGVDALEKLLTPVLPDPEDTGPGWVGAVEDYLKKIREAVQAPEGADLLGHIKRHWVPPDALDSNLMAVLYRLERVTRCPDDMDGAREWTGEAEKVADRLFDLLLYGETPADGPPEMREVETTGEKETAPGPIVEKRFAIRYPERLGPEWLNVDNLESLMYTDLCIASDLRPEITVIAEMETAPAKSQDKALREIERAEGWPKTAPSSREVLETVPGVEVREETVFEDTPDNICPHCGGDGVNGGKNCPACHGTGYRPERIKLPGPTAAVKPGEKKKGEDWTSHHFPDSYCPLIARECIGWKCAFASPDSCDFADIASSLRDIAGWGIRVQQVEDVERKD